METVVKPEFVTEEHLVYLDDLRKSGVVNMFGADQYLRDEFGFTKQNASAILKYWMETFSERNK